MNVSCLEAWNLGATVIEVNIYFGMLRTCQLTTLLPYGPLSVSNGYNHMGRFSDGHQHHGSQ